jgi:hypothetical protein
MMTYMTKGIHMLYMTSNKEIVQSMSLRTFVTIYCVTSSFYIAGFVWFLYDLYDL